MRRNEDGNGIHQNLQYEHHGESACSCGHSGSPAFRTIVITVVASIVVTVCFLTNPRTNAWQSDNTAILLRVTAAECDNVEYEYQHSTFGTDDTRIDVKWTNKTDDVLCFDDTFTLFRDGKALTPNRKTDSNTVVHHVNPGESRSESYLLSSYDLKQGNTYRLEKSFYLESNPAHKHTAFIRFRVDTRFSFIGKQYSVEKVVYANSSYSFTYTSENAPQFKMSESLEFLYKKKRLSRTNGKR